MYMTIWRQRRRRAARRVEWEGIAWLKQAVRVCEIIVGELLVFGIFRRAAEFMVTNWIDSGVSRVTLCVRACRFTWVRWFRIDYELNMKRQSTHLSRLRRRRSRCRSIKRHINHVILTYSTHCSGTWTFSLSPSLRFYIWNQQIIFAQSSSHSSRIVASFATLSSSMRQEWKEIGDESA